MPIYSKLLKGLTAPGAIAAPGGGDFDPAAEAIFAAFTDPPDDTLKGLINDIVTASPSAWAKLDTFVMLRAASAANAAVNWVAPGTFEPTNHGATIDAFGGLTGNGSSTYMATGYTPSSAGGNFTLNDASMGVGVLTDSVGSVTEIGCLSVAGGLNGMIIQAKFGASDPGLTNMYVNDFAALNVSNSDAVGRFAFSRTGASAKEGYRDGVSIGTSTEASVALPDKEIYVGALNNIGSAAQFSDRQIAYYFIGGALTGAEHAALDAAIAAYIAGT